jgi:transketolase N-terminal domain/subunit
LASFVHSVQDYRAIPAWKTDCRSSRSQRILGQGLSIACGAALSKRLAGDPHRVYVLMGDGESEEGQVWKLLCLLPTTRYQPDSITDWNGQQIDGPVDVNRRSVLEI